jgi:hypothetical protein
MKKNTGIPYETLVTRVFKEFVNQNAVRTIEVKHNVVLDGKTASHQIDVYWEFEYGGIKYRNIVQAKDWKSKIPKGAIEQLLFITNDLPGQPRGIFVTRSGYQKGAIELAERHGILLYTLGEPKEEFWEGAIKEITLTGHLFYPEIINVKLIPDNEWNINELSKKGIPSGKNQFKYSGNVKETILYNDAFSPAFSTYDILIQMIKAEGQKSYPPKDIAHIFREPIFYKTDSEVLPYLKLYSVEATISQSEFIEDIKYDLTAFVGFILENVLEKKQTIFDKDINMKKK